MKRFLAALQFLTIVPLPAGLHPDERALGGSLPFFPVVGLLTGAAVALADWGLGRLLPVGVTSVLAVIMMIAISGALHIDGLADTADGFFSSRPRDRILAIMRDSRTGPMGVIAIVCTVALKIALVASVAGPWRWWVLLLTPLAGRCALLTNIALLPYARPEGGLVGVFHQRRSRLHVLWALAVLLAVGGLAGRVPGMIAGGCAFIAGLLFAAYSFRRIGGLTGDTLGAACELTELVPALVTATMLHGGGA
ncbi:MAG: adenosylcobinamide-GDP ribazoletransferase [Proteobacteria bacterium]|nr:adenosylcobinamide-GDP ribazoletransferase [Pseudomonadota bacterium]MBU2262277.1 adenosylcobinamide-GDP ribazoletransferase [Pseudomonadota bacterium]